MDIFFLYICVVLLSYGANAMADNNQTQFRAIGNTTKSCKAMKPCLTNEECGGDAGAYMVPYFYISLFSAEQYGIEIIGERLESNRTGRRLLIEKLLVEIFLKENSRFSCSEFRKIQCLAPILYYKKISFEKSQL